MKDVWGHSGSMDQSLSELEIRHRTLAREAAVEGIVLLKNEEYFLFPQLQLLHCLEVGQKRLLKAELVPVM